MIRGRNYSNRVGGGERRAIGCIRKVSLSDSCWVEAFDLDGFKRPGRLAEIRRLVETAELESGNGLAVPISPKPGLTGESEGAANRTDSTKVSERNRSSRPGTSIPQWWSGDRQSLRGSERLLRDAGSSRNSSQVTSEVLIRRSQKGWRGVEELSLAVLVAKL